MLVVPAALAVIAVDHAAKLAAAWIEPSSYIHNAAPMGWDWVLLVPALALLVPSRVMALLLAVFLGASASNVIDVYVWPGGVPDFIPMGEWIWNPADFGIYGSIIALMAWPFWLLFRVARRKHPERLPTPVPEPSLRSELAPD